MSNLNLIEEIESVDWSNFDGPASYDSTTVVDVLHSLINLQSSDQADIAGDGLVRAIGNDHTGVYYPAALKALDFIIAIEKNTQNEARRVCALAILNDLHYFELDVGNYVGISAEELQKMIQHKLAPYSDESIKFPNAS